MFTYLLAYLLECIIINAEDTKMLMYTYTYVVRAVKVKPTFVKDCLDLLDVSTLDELREHPETDHNVLSQAHIHHIIGVLLSVMASVPDLMIARSVVRLPAIPLSGNNPGQVVHAPHAPQPVGAMPQFENPAD